MKLPELAGVRVCIWGIGIEGRAVIDALLRMAIPAQITIADDSDSGDSEYRGIPIERGDDAVNALNSARVVVKSPTISRYGAQAQELRNKGTTMTTATNLWFAQRPNNVIGITGTKGKTTSASLIAHFLEAINETVELTGNIGRPPIDALGRSQANWWVVELSSYQTSDLDQSPPIGVLTSLSPEHLDWHGDEQTYVQDKLNLFAHDREATVVVNGGNPGAATAAPDIPATVRVAGMAPFVRVVDDNFVQDEQILFPTSSCKLLGPHNLDLVATALEVLVVAGFDIVGLSDTLGAALERFNAVDHRLQVIATDERGISYVDDSISTTPMATIAALEAFNDRQVTVIVGGFDRGLSYEDLGRYVAERNGRVRVVTVPDSNTRVTKQLQDAMGHEEASDSQLIVSAETFNDGVKAACDLTEPNGVVLLSPGAPSYGQFKDYVERSAAFRKAVGLS
jgi:UDP-N-acetylmuramoyl-L-alanine---L-glutamate ligase